MRFPGIGVAAAIILAIGAQAESQVPAPTQLTYADLADLALRSPVVAHVRIDRSDGLSSREAVGTPPGFRRFLVEARIVALIRGDGGLPARLSYLVDVPLGAEGEAARPRRRTEYLVLASTVPERPGELRLTAPDAQIPFSPEAAARLRAILAESLDPAAPPAITGVGRAFHVPGSLPGESETQIFVLTADDRPISITILRRPQQQPRWSVALGEMVDEAAASPRPDTLLWYRLACGLPRALPRQAVEDADAGQAEAIREDYRLVLEGLGPCVRSRSRLP